ncbi:MAG: transporter substrate-binding domain-containing protein [Desulfuromonas sp.]|nr:transporter substrate-binding domain-containing protein [Desulfuromonas sp.]
MPLSRAAETTMISLTTAEKQWLADHPQITLAPDPDFHPVEFFDEQGEYQGIAADFITLLESRLGIQFQIVQLDNWALILERTKQRQVDLLGAVVNTPQRNEYLLFTEPFLEFPGVIVAQKGVTESLSLKKLRGMTIAIVKGYAGHELIALHYPEIKLEIVSDTSTGLRKVSFGMVDAFIGNLGTASFELGKEGISNLRIAGETGYVYRWALGCRKDWPMFHQILQKALASISSEERQAISRRWVRLESAAGLMTEKFWLTILGVAVVALLALAWVLMWNRILKKKVNLRTEELKLALVEEETARDNIDTILKSVADGLIVANMENRVVLMNRAAETLLHITLEQVLLQPIDVVLAAPEFNHYISQVLDYDGQGGTAEWDIDGAGLQRTKTIQARTAVVYNRAGEKTTITIVRDVTRERELDRMKTEFISTAAHELRTPLTAVMGYTELLLNPEKFGVTDPEQQKKVLNTIYDKAGRLDSIISDLLDLSRVQSGRLISLNRADCDINRFIETIIDQQWKNVTGHQFELCGMGAPVTLWADEKKLEQVMDNLISNAVKFSARGTTIWICGKVTGDSYQVTVKDEGIGMQLEQAERVFDKFYRVDSSDTAPGGLGLGMSIVKNIIEAHDGKIWVDSALGIGTSIHFTLPLPPTEGDERNGD